VPTAAEPAAPEVAVPRVELQDLDKFDIGKQAAAEEPYEEQEEELFDDPRVKILDAALAHVQRDGLVPCPYDVMPCVVLMHELFLQLVYGCPGGWRKRFRVSVH
jgi:hypothetical protein